MIETFTNTWQTKEGFEILFKKHYEPLCNFVFGMVKDYDASEDIIQDLFVKFWKKRNDLPDDIPIKAYLYRAARNMALNQIKHSSIKKDFNLFNRVKISDAEQNIGNPAEASELQKMIAQAVNELPAERKKIFLMSREDGLKYKEIAQELNISVKTVENQMGKALSTLRTELSDYLPAIIIAICIGIK
ncbi:MAG: RNA polymerase sigma-70 factor [Prevotella sp.]|nr:RNA polymerase sigma-70 factor [Prevotella sp.]MCH4183020.1 RNA polymerase sigma-70 factor [Prevotella sp.]MCH4212427.1 RNA polymerase sigma-70 factor [Prevotella sp.]MCH4241976.1 RNA polymerase sigma-70 factor [Prevotella sp.]